MTTRYRKIKRKSGGATRKRRTCQTKGGSKRTKSTEPTVELFFATDDETFPLGELKTNNTQPRTSTTGVKILDEIANYANENNISVINKPADQVLTKMKYSQTELFTEVYPLLLMIRKQLADNIQQLNEERIDIKRTRFLKMLFKFTKTTLSRIQTVERPLWLEKILNYIDPEEFALIGEGIIDSAKQLFSTPEIDSALIANVVYDASNVRKFRGRKLNPSCDNKMFAHYNFVSSPNVVKTVENMLTRMYTQQDKSVPHEKVVPVVAKVNIENSGEIEREDKI